MIEVAVLPWEKIDWSDERVQKIYLDWGIFNTHKQQLDIAANYYDKSLELKADDARALVYRSLCKRDIAQTEGALEDALAALGESFMRTRCETVKTWYKPFRYPRQIQW